MKPPNARVALITNSIVPYCYDVGKLLALPSGLTYRFRYIKKWLSPQLSPRDLKDKNAVILLRVFDTARLIPVRFAKIFDVSEFGDIVYIEFLVGKYVALENSGIIVKALEASLASIQAENVAEKDLKPLVIPVDQFSQGDGWDKLGTSSDAAWDRIVNELGRLIAFKDYSFFRILSVKNSEGKEAQFVDDEVRGKKAYSVQSLTLYFVELLQKMPWNIEKTESIEKEFIVRLSCYDNDVVVKQAHQKVVGKYDLLRFSFRIGLTRTKQYASLFLDVPRSEEKYLDESVASLPLVLSPSAREIFFKWTKVICGIIGIAGMGGADFLAARIGWAPDAIRALSLFFIVIAAGKWDELLASYLDKAAELRVG